MDEDDPLDVELRALADEAERHTPAPPGAASLRRLGNRRRRRRGTMLVAAVVAALVVGGGAVFSAARQGIDQPPSPAGPPGVSRSPDPPTDAVGHPGRDSAAPLERHSRTWLTAELGARPASGAHLDHNRNHGVPSERDPDTDSDPIADAEPHPDSDHRPDRVLHRSDAAFGHCVTDRGL